MIVTIGGDDKSTRRERGRNHKRQCGQADVVSGWKARIIGKQPDEMRRPDPAAGSDTGGRSPCHARATVARASAIEQPDGRQTRQEADDACDSD